MKKVLIGILIIILIICAFIGVKWGLAYINDNIEPIIYYSFNDNPNLPLSEDNSTFSNNMTIVWTENCTGVIKKDGEIISKKTGTLLSNDGIYEITTSSPSGKNKTTKIFRLDKTPPKVEIKKTTSGTYNILFDDINDIGEAILLKFDLDTNELISRTNLAEKIDILNQVITITEKGYYVFNAVDKIGNSTDSVEFSIE